MYKALNESCKVQTLSIPLLTEEQLLLFLEYFTNNEHLKHLKLTRVELG